MVTDERIRRKNRKCAKLIVPRLWHERHTIFTKGKTQHLRPFCGLLQYRSGGAVSILRWIVLILFVLPIAGALLGRLIGDLLQL